MGEILVSPVKSGTKEAPSIFFFGNSLPVNEAIVGNQSIPIAGASMRVFGLIFQGNKQFQVHDVLPPNLFLYPL